MAGATYSTNLGLAAFPETTDPKDYPEMLKLYNAMRALAYAVDNAGSGKLVIPFTDAVPFGRLVGFSDNGAGGVTVKLAGGPVGSFIRARGFCSTPNGVSAGTPGEITFVGLNTGFSGLTPGKTYFTSSVTPGNVSSGAPAPGNFYSIVGFALSSTQLWVNPDLQTYAT